MPEAMRASGIVAFAADTGKLLWQATGERASYSSPVAVTVGGVRHVIFVTRLNVVSINPADGSERFRFPFGKLGPTVNAANPVVFDEHLLVTASYGIGAVLAKIGQDGATVVWRDRDILASQYTTCVEKDGILYGIHGRQDGPPAELRCFDPMAQGPLERAFLRLCHAGPQRRPVLGDQDRRGACAGGGEPEQVRRAGPIAGHRRHDPRPSGIVRRAPVHSRHERASVHRSALIRHQAERKNNSYILAVGCALARRDLRSTG